MCIFYLLFCTLMRCCFFLVSLLGEGTFGQLQGHFDYVCRDIAEKWLATLSATRRQCTFMFTSVCVYQYTCCLYCVIVMCYSWPVLYCVLIVIHSLLMSLNKYSLEQRVFMYDNYVKTNSCRKVVRQLRETGSLEPKKRVVLLLKHLL